MAKKIATYAAEVELWKEHKCVACDVRFRYKLATRASGVGRSDRQAREDAQSIAERALRNVLKVRPCPACGCIQPEMEASVRATRYSFALVIGTLVVALSLVLGVSHRITIPFSVLMTTIGSAALFLLSLSATRLNLNRDLDANKGKARRLIAAGEMETDDDLNTIVDLGERSRRRLPPVQTFGLGCLFVAMIVAYLPEAVRHLCSWPVNRGWHPSVVGPGDQTMRYMDEEVTSLGRLWNGDRVTAVVRNAESLGLKDPTFSGLTRKANWGRDIESRYLANRAGRIWAKFRFPNDAVVAGQELDLDLQVAVRYPLEVPVGSRTLERNLDGVYTEKTTNVEERASVKLANSPGAGRFYFRIWLYGQSLIIAVSSLVGITFIALTRLTKGNPATLLEPQRAKEARRESIVIPERRVKRLN